MSTQYKRCSDVPTGVLADRLAALSAVIVKGDLARGGEFSMRIPAECDRDADLVLSEAARRLRHMPELPPLIFERSIQTLNKVKAWRDCDGNAGFPAELREELDLCLAAYEVFQRARSRPPPEG